jgi:hypothetical protein
MLIARGIVIAAVYAFGAHAQTCSGSAQLSWQAPTTNTDGSALSDLAGFKVYWGQAQGSYTSSQTISSAAGLSYTVGGLCDGTWYFVVTSVNAAQTESAYSNVASKTFAPSSGGAPPTVTSTRIESAEWTCRDSSGAILTSHTRQDKAQESCTNRALAAPGTVFELRPSGYRIVAQ